MTSFVSCISAILLGGGGLLSDKYIMHNKPVGSTFLLFISNSLW